MSAYATKLDDEVVPTADTKIVLAGKLHVPPLAIGTWQWGDTTYWDWKPEHVEENKKAFHLANELGLTFFDTAEVYGNGQSERQIGAFRKDSSEDELAKQVIATKYFPYEERTQFPDVLLSALKDSLDRLGMAQGDLYQIHAPIHKASFEVVGNALADAIQAGLIKAVGVSNYNADEIKEIHAALGKRNVPLASNQVSFSLIRTSPLKTGVVQTCHDLGVAILAYSPIGMGLLTGKFGKTGPWPPARERLFNSLDPEQLTNLLDTLEKLAEKYSKTQVAVALNWTIAKGTIPLAGVRTPEHVRQNAEALGFRLAPADVAALDKFAFEGTTNKEWAHG
ncbi:Aldo/keto reductase [Hesseltinella vesiculosa]|uniref:Aldo/keto reductase n=1 Tax=Hesseltinella vesiculosa TaxID=101127 RepID=A0A1X2GPX2_9FUNG|nr:Aldo/keto reductase [Hesseltinella vesiculosa]